MFMKGVVLSVATFGNGDRESLARAANTKNPGGFPPGTMCT